MTAKPTHLRLVGSSALPKPSQFEELMAEIERTGGLGAAIARLQGELVTDKDGQVTFIPHPGTSYLTWPV
jgi:hypothetical protein